MKKQVYCGEEVAGKTGAGQSGFSGSETDDVGEPSGGGEART